MISLDRRKEALNPRHRYQLPRRHKGGLPLREKHTWTQIPGWPQPPRERRNWDRFVSCNVYFLRENQVRLAVNFRYDANLAVWRHRLLALKLADMLP